MQWSEVKVTQLCLILTVHGVLQTRILEWVDFPFSRGSSQPMDQTRVSRIAGWFFTFKLLIAKFRLKLNKVGKITRPFRYNLNQIPYDSTVEVRNRFKGLDLIDRMPDDLWMGGSWHCTGGRDKDHPHGREMQKDKWLSEEALQIAVKRRKAKSKGEKERYTHLNAEFQRIARRHKKAFLSDQCKEIAENNWMGKTRDLFKKLEILREHFRQRWA